MKLLENLDRAQPNHPYFNQWVNKLEPICNKTEDFLEKQRASWNRKLDPLYDKLKQNPDNLLDLQATVLSYRQMLTEEIAMFMNKLSRDIVLIKNAKSDRFMFYSTGFGLKTNLQEKKLLIDSELAELEHKKQILETHLEFLKEAKVMCDNLGWAVKNRIEIYNLVST
jgi:hypothetical protein